MTYVPGASRGVAAYASPARAFGAAYQPSTTRPTVVHANVTLAPSAAAAAAASVEISADGSTGWTEIAREASPASAASGERSIPPVEVPGGYYYRVRNVADPGGANAIVFVREGTR